MWRRGDLRGECSCPLGERRHLTQSEDQAQLKGFGPLETDLVPVTGPSVLLFSLQGQQLPLQALPAPSSDHVAIASKEIGWTMEVTHSSTTLTATCFLTRFWHAHPASLMFWSLVLRFWRFYFSATCIKFVVIPMCSKTHCEVKTQLTHCQGQNFCELKWQLGIQVTRFRANIKRE